MMRKVTASYQLYTKQYWNGRYSNLETDYFILKIIITENKPSFDKQVELV